ncbi:MAG: Shedu anti-phage system protein SduA domain-containing protein [Candidatus Bathyarchaeia archaeon]
MIEARSEQVERIIFSEQRKWGKRNIAFLPAEYDGNGKPIVRPFITVNLVARPAENKPIVFKNFKIHDALLVNCYLRDNVRKGLWVGKKARLHALKHNLRIFNAVLTKSTLSNCSLISFEDFLMLQGEKPKKARKIEINSIIQFLKAYISTFRRFGTLLPDRRKGALPEYIQFRFKISVIVCKDGIVIWFKRAIKKKRDSIKTSAIRSLSSVIPILSADTNIYPLSGQSMVIRDLAIVTRKFRSFYTMPGTVLNIRDDFGILEVKSGSDVRFENVLLGYVDSRGKPRQIALKGFWVFAKDEPSLFSVDNGKKRAQRDFFRALLRDRPIKGEKMGRYQEADLAREIDDVKRSYASLVARENAEEPELQQFLERHPFILSSTYLDVMHVSLDITPQARLSKGKRKVDFLLLFEPDFEKVRRLVSIIEIKRPSHKLFTKKGKLSKHLREGLEQVEEAFRILEENPQAAMKWRLRSSDVISGRVLIGRFSDLQEKELSYLEELAHRQERIKVMTFDSLLENLETVKGFYGVKGREPVVVVGQEGTADEDFTGTTEKTIQSAVDYLKKGQLK